MAYLEAATDTTLRGAAFEIFHRVAGAATLLASALAGALWSWSGPAATLLAGAAFARLAPLGFAGTALTARQHRG